MLPCEQVGAEARSTNRDVELRCFPQDDHEFLRETQRAVAESRELAIQSEDKLRSRYPHAVVRPREPLATVGPTAADTWYVYRDGTLVA